MLAVFQVLTIGTMIAATYLIYQALGARRTTLLFTRQEKRDWDEVVSGSLGRWLTGSNIFATLTSLATVYVFFIGNTYFFGGWAIVSLVTMIVGGFVTMRATRALMRHLRLSAAAAEADQSSSVLLSLFWDTSAAAKSTTTVIKWITLINISAVLWLDFTVFADISSRLIGSSSIVAGAAVLFLCSFSVLHFTIKYGLRGFVFADLFQSPLIIIGSIVLLFGALSVIAGDLATADGKSNYGAVLLKMKSIFVTPAPGMTLTNGLLFSISCLFLNSFLMLATPPHWLRMWAFGHKELTVQIRSVLGTSAVWLVLVIIGMLAGVYVSLNQPDHPIGSNEVVVIFLSALATKGSVLFAVAFWVAGMAALFASADVQIYSFWLVQSYDVETGKLSPTERAGKYPMLFAALGSMIFAAFYVLVRVLDLPFDRLVLVLLPSCLTIVPPIVLALRRARQTPLLPIAAITLYATLSAGAFFSRDFGETLSIAAPIAPLIISIAALWMPRGAEESVIAAT